MGEIKIDGYVCERCAHKWIARANSVHKPFVCPKCKSPYWNVPRKAHSMPITHRASRDKENWHRKKNGGKK